MSTLGCERKRAAACVENKLAQISASWLSGGFSQRQITPQAAPGCGQPRPISHLVRAGRPHRPCFRQAGSPCKVVAPQDRGPVRKPLHQGKQLLQRQLPLQAHPREGCQRRQPLMDAARGSAVTAVAIRVAERLSAERVASDGGGRWSAPKALIERPRKQPQQAASAQEKQATMSPTPSGANLLHSVERQEHIGLERPDEVAPDALAAVGHRTALPTREADGDGARWWHGPRARSSASLKR